MRSSPFLTRRGVTRAVSTGATGNRLLIVDDSELTARMMRHLLTRAGFACEHAANGQIAVNMWKHEVLLGRHFDATFMDKVSCSVSGCAACACCGCRVDVYFQRSWVNQFDLI
jgi:CheY-like chemotaxis protein